MNETLHVRKHRRNVVIVGLVLFTAMSVLSVGGCLWEGLAGPALLCGGLCGFLVCLFGLVLLAYRRSSLCIADRRLTARGMIGVQTMELGEVVAASWRFPRSIVLRTPARRMHISLDRFEPEQQLRLIRFLRQNLPAPIQQGWDRFCYQVAVPLLNSSAQRPLATGQVRITRRSFDRLFLYSAIVAGLLAVIVACCLRELRWLVMPLPVLLMWPIMRYTHPAEGVVCDRMSRSNADGQFAIGACAVLAVGSAGMKLFDVFWERLPCPEVLATVGLLLLWAAMPLLAYRTERRRWRERAAEVENALREWERRAGAGCAD